MKRIFLLFFVLIAFSSIAQKRIGFDINSHLINLNYSVHYQEVIKGPLLYSLGVFAGKYGHGEYIATDAQIANGYVYPNAFPNIENVYTNPSGSYNLIGQFSIGSGVGVSAGIGLFHEFGPQHGIRFNLNQRFGWMRTWVRSTYRANHYAYSKTWHPITATTLELYHTIRLTGRSTLYWGIKTPYYITLDRGRFNPQIDSEVFQKMKLDLSLGFTFVVGNCD